MTLAEPIVYNEGMRNVIELISSQEAAALLDMTRQGVNLLVHNGRLPAYKVGGRLYFNPDDVQEYKRTRRMGRPRKSDQS